MYNFNEVIREEKEYHVNFPKEIQELRVNMRNNQFAYSLGVSVCGPLYAGFCQAALELALRENIHIIFPLMREGNLYSKILDIMVSIWHIDMKIVPLWVSRMSSYMGMCYGRFDKAFLHEMCTGQPPTVKEAFRKLRLEKYSCLYSDLEEEINRSILDKDSSALDTVFNRIVGHGLDLEINSLIAEKKELLSLYLAQSGAVEDFLTLDIGSRGTLPQAIDNCSKAGLKKIHLFMCADPDAKPRIERGHDIRYIFSSFEKSLYDIANLLFYHLFESFTMGEMRTGSALGYRREPNGTVSVVTKSIEADSYTAGVVRNVQYGILAFTRKYCESFPFSSGTNMLLSNGAGAFCRLMNAPRAEEAALLGSLVIDESASGESLKLIQKDSRLTRQAEGFPQKGNFFIKGIAGTDTSIWIQGKLISDKHVREAKEHKCVYAVYGCGNYGKMALELLPLYGIGIKCIIDQKLAGGEIMGYPIIALEQLKAYDVEHILIASIPYAKEMAENIADYEKRNNKKYVIHYICLGEGSGSNTLEY